MGTTHYNNQYAADYMETPDYSAAVGGKNNKKRRYKGGMNELTPASFKGFAGCANWAGGKRRSRKLRRKSLRGGLQRKTFSNLIEGGVSYDNNLSGGKRRARRTRKLRKSRRH